MARQLILVEFGGELPFTVWVRDGDKFEQYDFDAPRHYREMHYRMSGVGPFDPSALYLEHGEHWYWLAPEVAAKPRGARGYRLKTLPRRMNGVEAIFALGHERDIGCCTGKATD